MPRPHVLLAIDRYGWAFHHIAEQLVKHLGREFQFTVIPYQTASSGVFDAVVAFWWGAACLLRGNVQCRKQVLCIYDGYSWSANVAARQQLDLAVKQSDLAVFGNEALLREVNCGLPAFVCEDGVNTQMFSPRPLPGDFTVGWTGNSTSSKKTANVDDNKGLGLIREACRMAGVPLVTQDIAFDPLLKQSEMADRFYARVSVYACASKVEGTPNPVLEAMACGRPVVTTDVGLVRRLVADGVNGYVVPRTVEGLAAAIVRLHLAPIAEFVRICRLARFAAEGHDWSHKIGMWRVALHAAVS